MPLLAAGYFIIAYLQHALRESWIAVATYILSLKGRKAQYSMGHFLLNCFSKFTFELPGIETLLTIKLIQSDSRWCLSCKIIAHSCKIFLLNQKYHCYTRLKRWFLNVQLFSPGSSRLGRFVNKMAYSIPSESLLAVWSSFYKQVMPSAWEAERISGVLLTTSHGFVHC
jgi:hypothetical protein